MQRDKLISLLITTKGRLPRLKTLLDSIKNKTYNYDWIDVVIGIDEDDLETLHFLSDYESPFQVKIVALEKMSPYFDNSKAMQILAGHSDNSYYLWVLGNDTEIITQHWDNVLYTKLNRYFNEIEGPSNYHYIFFNDNTHAAKPEWLYKVGVCFPLISRNWFEKVGIILPLEFPRWGADIALFEKIIIPIEQFKLYGLANDLEIMHYCHHNGSAKRDDVSLAFGGMEPGANINVSYYFEKTGSKPRHINWDYLGTDYSKLVTQL
jgi:hypothetical protein